ncbi:hypothetical protein B0T16DRAFT_69071 [Cercophora newfieldiana]|uniref:Uncharacterized protein n=1 Tax=Cercophora newfieldiana TaxID=92897 RepID=A0AA40D2H2_9PEZI|nr:hypothetical protein B0T16DRAFT_69071 [Cercophora newfieldiana]
MTEYVPTAFEKSLIELTSPDPWNQIVVLSCKTINEGFSRLYDAAKAKDPMSTPLCHIDLKPRTITATMVANLKPSQVIANVVEKAGDKVPMLYFQWNFESGTMSVPLEYEEEGTKDYDLQGWRVAFATKIVSEPVSTEDERYGEIKKRMGDPVGDFSISRLFLQVQGFRSDQVGYYAPGSYFGGINWDKEPAAPHTAFNVLLDVWASKMKKGWHDTVGFRLVTSKPETVQPHAPTFPPTSITYTTYPWIDPTTPRDKDNGSSANALCYLIMTKNRAPSTATPLLPYTGTWVTADKLIDPGRDAIMCISAPQFWGEWLLPQMRALNLAAHVQPLEPTLEADGFNGASIQLDFEAGRCTAHPESSDAYFAFKPGKDGEDEEGKWNSKWEWKSNDELCRTRNHMKNHEMKWTLNQDAWARTSVAFAKGGNTITISGEVGVHAMVNATLALTSWGTAEMTGTQPFSITYRLCGIDSGVESGGLQVVRDPGTRFPDPIIKTSGPSGAVRIDNWEDFCQKTTDNVASSIIQKLGLVDGALLRDLKGVNRFFLPGAGVFNFARPMFNKRGDMVTNLSYTGWVFPFLSCY